MSNDFLNIKIQSATVSNNDVSISHIEFHKQINEVDHVDLPEDYLAFIEQFGEGAIGAHIYIFPIDKLMERTQFWRVDNQTKAEVLFFNKHDRNECTAIGETSDGDIVMYLKGMYYLSTRQYEEKIYKLGSELNDVLEFHRNHKLYGGRCDINSFNVYSVTTNLPTCPLKELP